MYKPLSLIGLVCLALVFLSGCITTPATRNFDLEAHVPPAERIPNEEVKTAMPPYIIEPPDVLLIDAMRVVPKAPYILEPLDIVQIQADNVLPDFPIGGEFQIDASGKVNLGSQYGKVKIAGLSTEQAETTVQDKLLELLVNPLASVVLIQTTGSQQIGGPHQVNPDGTVNLGTYGQVFVAGMTLDEARKAVEKHLEEFLESPSVIVDVSGYNSKVYYIITDGATLGDQVRRVPIRGGETVLDAISGIGGFGGGSTKDIWIARPAPDHGGYEQRLPIHWDEIVKKGITATNYQVFPNDRIYIRASEFNRIDASISRVTAPISRISGVIFLFRGAIQSLSQSLRRGGRGFGGNNNNFSDIRLKTDIQLAGKSSSGIQIYQFRYKWDDQRYEGVMAQDLLRSHPQAVHMMPNGYYAVDYGQIDVEFREVSE